MFSFLIQFLVVIVFSTGGCSFTNRTFFFIRDRPWQAYPITILTGAYLGYVVGSLIARTPLLYGKRIEFTSSSSPEEEREEISSNSQEASKEK